MRYLVILENPRTGEKATFETTDFDVLRIDPNSILAIIDKRTQLVTYDGEMWDNIQKQ